jgi:hypothetical protein
MTIQTASTTAHNSTLPRELAPLALALLFLPLLGAKKMRQSARHWLCFVILLGGMAASLALTGCGGSYFSQTSKSYAVTVTATSGSLQRNFNVTLNLQ